MPVETEPLSMSMAPNKDYLEGWNACHKMMAEEVVRLDDKVEDLKAAGRKSSDDAASALDLLSRIRFALGDNGTRMQDELLEYCLELRDSAGALAALGEEYDALKGRVEELEDQIKREGRMIAAQQGLRAELQADRDRYRAALETIADPSTASMTYAGTVDTLRSHARLALEG